jgi:hypothetical protein
MSVTMEKFVSVAIFLQFGDKRLKTGAVKEKLLWQRDEGFIGHG